MPGIMNWSLCFICQKSTKDSLRSTDDGLKKLATNIPKFNELDGLKFEYSRIADVNEDLLTILTTRKARYHNGCQSQYSDTKLERLKDSIKSKQRKDAEREAQTEPPDKRSRRSSGAGMEPGPFASNLFQCCWCTKYDDEANLHAAGQLWAKKRPNAEQVDQLTQKWKSIAAVIKHEHILRILSHGDVSSNELFYHVSCLTKYTRDYKRLTQASDTTDTTNEKWIKELTLNKIVLHIKDVELTNPGTIFVAGELESMYLTILDGYNIASLSHVSRFADKLVARTPGLIRGLTGNKVSLFFNSAVQEQSQNPDDFFESLSKLVGPVRQAMRLKAQSSRTGVKFDKNNQIESIPIELLTMVNFILEGINLAQHGFSKESLAIAQAMQFNFRFNRDGKSILTKKRHDKCKETPFPLYVALKIYSHSRSKTIINWLYFCAGISISYDRLLSLTRELALNLLRQYKRDGVFIPRNLRKNIFTIIAKDNIDVNARSTTATKHYHGTSFSVFQFPSNDLPGEPITYPEPDEATDKRNTSKKVDRLPSSYTEVHKFLTSSPSLKFSLAPNPVSHELDEDVYDQGTKEEYEWLEHAFDSKTGLWLNWAKHHAAKFRSAVRSLDISAILPPLDDPVHTLDMQHHCMDYILKTKNFLNPYQVAVDVCDQPIFALTRELMIRFPEKYGPDKYFCLFGSLHIEKALLTICGQLVKGSGLDEIMATCGLSIVGGDSLVTVNHIKRARYCLQVAACALHSKLVKAHDESKSTEPVRTWLSRRSESNEMSYYWKLILKLKLDVLTFIRSIREGNFALYVAMLRRLVIWYFIFDHYHYARWISVHLYDLLALPQYAPHLHKCFMDGYFTFQKTDRQFSLLGLDQVHEQNNAVMKGMGGVTSSVNKEDESSLARWGLCIHELASIIEEYEHEETELDSPHEAQRHHEDTLAFQKRFSTDVSCLEKAMISNPFCLDKLTVLNNEDEGRFNDCVFENVRILESEGEKQFNEFWNKRLASNEQCVSDKIQLNSYKVPGNYDKRAVNDPVMTANMMAKFVDAAKSRRNSMENILNFEVFGIAQSLANDQFSLYHGTKSSVIGCLENSASVPKVIEYEKGACVIDLSMLFRKKQPTWVTTFADFSKFIYDEVMDISSPFKRCDVIADRYFEGSLKEGTRSDRGSGKGLVIPFDNDTVIPSNFDTKFLTNVTNKTNLNNYLSEKFLEHHRGKQSVLVVTAGNSVVSNSGDIHSEPDIVHCTSEEADPRIVRHVINLSKMGYSQIRVKTIDSDVVMLCLAYAGRAIDNGVQKYDVLYGPKEKCINIVENYRRLGDDVCRGIPFYNAFTGCDTVSSFYKVGKAKFWTVWNSKIKSNDNILTGIFQKLSCCPLRITEEDFNALCNFVYDAYNLSKQTPFKSRRTDQLISTLNINLRMLVPSPSGILQHVKRACIQAGYLWKLAEQEIIIPDPTEWGWNSAPSGSFVPRWQDEDIIDIKPVLSTCSCVKGVCTGCSCSKSGVRCLIYCKCDKAKCKSK